MKSIRLRGFVASCEISRTKFSKTFLQMMTHTKKVSLRQRNHHEMKIYYTKAEFMISFPGEIVVIPIFAAEISLSCIFVNVQYQRLRLRVGNRRDICLTLTKKDREKKIAEGILIRDEFEIEGEQ